MKVRLFIQSPIKYRLRSLIYKKNKEMKKLLDHYRGFVGRE